MRLYHIAAATLLIGTSALAFQGAAPKLAPVADHDWVAPEPDAGNPDLDLAIDPASVPEQKPASETVDTTYAGVGGPDEEAEAGPMLIAAAEVRNYPPCAPGPGDDHCIQLYEPGVRTALAAWSGPTGGLLELGQAKGETGVGGPYEPVASVTSETGMNGDFTVDPALGEVDDDA